jgi:phosphatidylinositol transfer protein SFH5
MTTPAVEPTTVEPTAVPIDHVNTPVPYPTATSNAEATAPTTTATATAAEPATAPVPAPATPAATAIPAPVPGATSTTANSAPATPTTAPAANKAATAPAADEPQSELTRKFTKAEWEALRTFRTDLPRAFKDAYPDDPKAETRVVELWGVKIDPTAPATDARVSVVLMKFLRAR